jgi:hypothetical protein
VKRVTWQNWHTIQLKAKFMKYLQKSLSKLVREGQIEWGCLLSMKNNEGEQFIETMKEELRRKYY